MRYRPLQLLEESDDENDDEWQGEARGDPSCSITGSSASSPAMEAASVPLTRSLLERETVLILTKWHAAFTAMGGGWLDQYLFYILFRVSILLLAVGCTVFFCPEAAGSGIPEMRSILGGFPFPNYLSGRALIAKCLGLALALGSGLSIGKEGPFVHLSSIIARQLLGLSWFEQIRKSSDLTHHVLAAACAVGVTASFGAPVGGVLFSIEVTTSYYVTSNYWRAFFSSVVGVVVFRGLNSLLAGSYGTLFTTEFGALPYETFEIAFFLLLAVICGLLGALFVRSFRMLLGLKKWFEDQYLLSWCGSYPGFAPFVYAAFVAFMFSLVEFPVGSFMQLTQRQTINDMFSAGKLESDQVSTHLEVDFGSSWTSPSLLLNLFVYVFVRFWSTAISATVLAPCGIVTPVFAIGAALGRLFGEMVVILSHGELLVAGYAVVGAASFTAGVTGTISIAVIVFELTGQLSYMIPVLLCVIVGRAVTLFFSLDMYETMGRQKNLPQWPDLTKQKSYSLTAGDLMRDVLPYYLVRRQTLASIKHLLQVTSSGKKGSKIVRLFPVVDDAKTMILLGVATRDELEALVVQWELSLRRAKSATDTDTRAAVAGITPEQAAVLSRPSSETSEVVDLVQLELLTLEDEHFHVPRDTFASHVILLISMHKCPQLFVTQRGRLQGSIHAADLLARSRRYTL
ncbi:hypothetical protein BBJ29_004774 [Phytophthora kernoviae]|uniref:Chloride channel protein n=1 Tax=Phytophthora kernoviae TaxID=325452 RepID=A0A3F2RJZ4_9STRA|nr:hypothetical protein BBP00_00007335 [Phytophthora kernoviae]RLN70892.1 hypothetical protein BBJ29_004774 [Phytophthora kernoviae]